MKKNKKGRVIIPDTFDPIQLEDLLPGDILLFIHGNKLTEWHGRNRKKKYGRSTLPPFHAAIVYQAIEVNDGYDVFILDPEISTSLSFLKEYLQKEKLRIDIVRFKATDKQRQKIQDKIKEVGSNEGLYDWKGFGSFASQMPYIGWMFGWVKPSKKNFYCSDAVTFCIHDATKIKVSPRANDFTAPVDLQIWGIKHHDLYTVKQRNEVL